MLFRHFQQYFDRTAVICNGREITYQQLQKDVDRFKQYFSNERQLVFILANNNYATVVAYVACIQARHPVLLLSAENAEQSQQVINNYQPNYVVHTLGELPEAIQYNQEKIALHNELALLLTTSGSTGSPKLVKLTDTNIFSNTQAIILYLQLTATDRAISTLKLNYSYGLSILNTHLQVGGSIVLTENSVTEAALWQDIVQYSVTSFSGVPYNFELLAKQKFSFSAYPSIRYVTQAGGKLAGNLIDYFAKDCEQHGSEFFVMYGQTEAAPRIAYLPPEYLTEYPDFIGVAVPFGEMALIDENQQFITEPEQVGELIYRGPNVMMGYATCLQELALKEEISWLHTGDLAYFNKANLFKITGRKARFVKPFGIRVSLDDIAQDITALGVIAVTAAYKEKIVIAIEHDSLGQWNEDKILTHLTTKYLLPKTAFYYQVIDKIPLLSNGKTDLKAVAASVEQTAALPQNKCLRFWHLFKHEFLMLSGFKQPQWVNVFELYSHFFHHKKIEAEDSFISLAGDSLLYVTISTELEYLLGKLPQCWHKKSIAELETIKDKNDF